MAYAEEKVTSEFEDAVISVRRVSKTTKGGRTMNFSAFVVVGNRNGRIGCGSGKAKDVALAVEKAKRDAMSKITSIALKEGRTFYHDVRMKVGASRIVIKPAPQGTGIIAGGAMRQVFDLLGVQDVVAKSLGSSTPHNLVRATIKACEGMQSLRSVSRRREATSEVA